MYEGFYGLVGSPFRLTPDSRFFFQSQGHGKAMAYLRYGLSQGEGFIVITGDVGAGKSTLIEQILSELDPNQIVAAQVVTSNLDGDSALRLVASAFGITPPSTDKAAVLKALGDFFGALHRQNRRALLVIDEVQNLPRPSLEEIRMLSNIAVGGRAVLQIFLAGQPQFKAVLGDPAMEQIRQRVLAYHHLGPLTEAETRGYIEHRLNRSGWSGRPAFDPETYLAIHLETGGVPRRINLFCSRLLLYCALEGIETITPTQVRAVAEELCMERQEGSHSAQAMPGSVPGAMAVAAPAVPDLRLAAINETLSRHERVLNEVVGAVTRLVAVFRAGPPTPRTGPAPGDDPSPDATAGGTREAA